MPTLAEFNRQQRGGARPNVAQFGSQLIGQGLQGIALLLQLLDKTDQKDKAARSELLELRLKLERATNDAQARTIMLELDAKTGQILALKAAARKRAKLDPLEVKKAEQDLELGEQALAGGETQNQRAEVALASEQRLLQETEQKAALVTPLAGKQEAFVKMNDIRNDLERASEYFGRPDKYQKDQRLATNAGTTLFTPVFNSIILAFNHPDRAQSEILLTKHMQSLAQKYDIHVTTFRRRLEQEQGTLATPGFDIEEAARLEAISQNPARSLVGRAREAFDRAAFASLLNSGANFDGTFNPETDGSLGYLFAPGAGAKYDTALTSRFRKPREFKKMLAAGMATARTTVGMASQMEDLFVRVGLGADVAETLVNAADPGTPSISNVDKIIRLATQTFEELLEIENLVGKDNVTPEHLDSISSLGELIQETRKTRVVQEGVVSGLIDTPEVGLQLLTEPGIATDALDALGIRSNKPFDQQFEANFPVDQFIAFERFGQAPPPTEAGVLSERGLTPGERAAVPGEQAAAPSAAGTDVENIVPFGGGLPPVNQFLGETPADTVGRQSRQTRVFSAFDEQPLTLRELLNDSISAENERNRPAVIDRAGGDLMAQLAAFAQGVSASQQSAVAAGQQAATQTANEASGQPSSDAGLEQLQQLLINIGLQSLTGAQGQGQGQVAPGPPGQQQGLPFQLPQF